MRLQKYLAMAGIASRRKSEEYIEAGIIKVNGKVVKEMGFHVDPGKDIVEFRNKPVRFEQKHIYIILNKPKGIVATCRQRGEIPVTSLITGIKERLFPVGRLDKDSTGLVILTNDGDFAYQMTHPKFEHEKEYFVETTLPVADEKIEKLRAGIRIGNKKTQPAEITVLSSKKFMIILKEGISRQIRKMFGAVGAQVKELHRIRIGYIKLEGLKEGMWKELVI